MSVSTIDENLLLLVTYFGILHNCIFTDGFKHIFSLPARSPCSICYADDRREDGECIRECIHIDCPEFLGYELPCVDAERPEGQCCSVCPNGTSHEVISCPTYVDNKRRSRGLSTLPPPPPSRPS